MYDRLSKRTHPITLVLCFLAVAALVACGPASSSDGGDGATGGEAGADDHADRMAEEHAGDEPVASGAAGGEPAMDVTGQEVVYATVDGVEVSGFLAVPAEGSPKAGLIVIHEWWGLNDNIRDMARRLAGEGYAALAVDMYGGEAADEPQQARALMMQVAENTAAAEDNLRQAYDHLTGEVGVEDVGSIGWCFGGGWSLATAVLMPEKLDAAVIYYGRLVTERNQLATLATPILGIFGSEDRGIPVESVREFESALEELGKPAEIHVYEGADHAFANPSGTRFNEEAAEAAWLETTAFLAEHLGG